MHKTQDEIVQQYYVRKKIWEEKPQIRLVYARWIKRITPFLPPNGPILEVGSGSGLLRDFIPDIILSDVTELPWIDRVVDCMHIPFGDGALSGVIGFDIVHHLGQPHAFLEEVARVLTPGGRAVFIEPYMTFFSFLCSKVLHPESIYFKDYHQNQQKSDPWEGNLALANLVFKRDLATWPILHPGLTIVHRDLFSFFDFACAGGFRPYAFMPHGLFKQLVKLDDVLTWLMPLIAFRICVVLEKKR